VPIWTHDDEVKEGGKFEISYGGGNYCTSCTSAPKRILPKDGNYRTLAPKVLLIHVGSINKNCHIFTSKVFWPSLYGEEFCGNGLQWENVFFFERGTLKLITHQNVVVTQFLNR
jgi:hypothetical protein